VTSVEIGYTDVTLDTTYTEIRNVLYFAERTVSVEGDMVTPLTMINTWVPGEVHQNHKYLELELGLDTDWLETTPTRTTRWAYTQQTEAGVVASRAIKQATANSAIQYFLVNVREHDGTAATLCYTCLGDNNYGATNALWCTGETSEFSNEDGTPHQTVTFKFICLQDKVRT